jgi:anaerobic ribonucleoside-triphosphate reductase activating protein
VVAAVLKYLNSDIVFQEIPDEVALAINITGCPCRCPGCHSPYLWNDIGEPLTDEAIDKLIEQCHSHITCVALMGGDAIPAEVNRLMQHLRTNHGSLHTAWYSGRSLLSPALNLKNFDYIKLGPYLAHLGPLRSRRTNQRMYKVSDGKMQDITSRFWMK